MNSARNGLAMPLAGTLAVLILSPALVLLTGWEPISVLVLPVLIGLGWWLARLSRREMGFTRGERGSYGVALLYPCLVMSVLALVAWLLNAIALKEVVLGEFLLKLLVNTVGTAIGVVISEDGFFRGWLWGSLSRSRLGEKGILLWTSLAFMLWHLPVAIIEPEFRLPMTLIPIYLGNVLLIGLNWGLLRLKSGSVFVPAVSHGLWNGLAYMLFGFGDKTGTLGIEWFGLLGPERGLLGLLANGLVFIGLWRWAFRSHSTGPK
jgi:membrane protease YdiL (CAAX protease family)